MKNKKSVVLAVFAALSTSAHAFEIKLSGQLSIGALVIDDGKSTQSYIVDNSNSSSRFRITGSGNINEDLVAGIRYEFEYESNASSKTGTGTNYDSSETDKDKLTERYADIYLIGKFGELYLGQGDGAANGMTHVDLSGTNVAALLGNYDHVGGATLFRGEDEDGDVEGEGPTVVEAMRNWDFESRYDRLQYISPQLGAFTLSASAGRKNKSREVYEVSSSYAASFGFGKVAAGLGYAAATEENASEKRETLGGSVSVLLNSGLNGAISYSRRTAADDYDADNISFRLGYRKGRHATSIDYGVTSDRAMKGDEVDVVSLNYVYQPIDWAELYTTARQFSLDRPGADFHDITAYMVGGRIKF